MDYVINKSYYANQPETKILYFLSVAEESCKVHVTFVPRIIIITLI